MPEEVDACVRSVLDDNPDMDESEAWTICQAEQKARENGSDDPIAVKAVAAKKLTGDWMAIHPAEKTATGREHLLTTYVDKIPETESTETVKFKADIGSPMRVLYKDDDRMVIWGPASVEVVDQENDKITASALEGALPQLLRRKRLSLEHSDQLVGKILDEFETDKTKTVKIDGHAYERNVFPTDVLDPEQGDDVPEKGLYVAGQVWSDTQQARETQEKIEQGIIDSYSISGEAIKSATRVKQGEVIDEINELDLSAVTLCERGMNQKAKFAVIAKSDVSLSDLPSLAKTALTKTMSEHEDENEDSPSNASEAAIDKEELRNEFKSAAEEVLDGRDFATKDDILTRSDVEEIVVETLKEEDYDEEDDEMPELDDEDDEIEAADDEEDMPPVEDEMPELDDEDDEVEVPDNGGAAAAMTDEVEAAEDSHRLSLEQLKSELPDELYRAVAEHLTDPGPGQIAASDEQEAPDDDSGVSKADRWAEQIDGALAPVTHRQLEKDFEKEDDEDGGTLLDAFYETVEG